MLLQFVQTYAAGEPLQLAVSVTCWPTVGVELLALIVHAGGDVAGAVQFTVTCAELPTPSRCSPTSVYVFEPAPATESLQLAVVRRASRPREGSGTVRAGGGDGDVLPVCGAVLFADSEHTGVAADARQFTDTKAVEPTPVELLAVSE